MENVRPEALQAGYAELESESGGSRRARGWGKRLAWFARTYPLGAFGAVLIVILVIVAAVPQAFASHGYDQVNIADRLQGPSASHWLGTDDQGRDQFSRIVYGAQTSIFIGLAAVVLAGAMATLLGIVSAYWGGWTDLVVQRVVDVWMAFPGLIFVIFVVALFGTSRWTIIATMALMLSAGASRVVRSRAIEILGMPFIEAARSTGCAHSRIIFRHILPNVVPIVIVNASVQIAAVILIEASLSFLGFGIPRPFPSWGRMLQESQRFMYHEPMLAIVPGAAIALTVYALNLFGDALRDAMDPRLRGKGL